MSEDFAHHPKLDLDAREITLDSSGLSECTYFPSDPSSKVQLLRCELYSIFPETAQDDLDHWDMIGKTEADGRNYFEPTISVTIGHPPPVEMQKRWRLPVDIECVDCYTIKYQLVQKRRILKVYDGAFQKYRLIDLPNGSIVGKRFGLGRHFGDERLKHNLDLYFFHREQETVQRHFGQTLPQFAWDSLEGLKFFGVCFDSASGQIIKLKRYIYPKDLTLDHPERI